MAESDDARVRVLCPHDDCDGSRSLYFDRPKTVDDFECPECGAEYECMPAKMRAKRTRKHLAPDNRWVRSYSLRATDITGRQHHFEFVTPDMWEIELRQGDRVILYFGHDRLQYIHNRTVREMSEVRSIAKSGCAVLLAIAGLLFGAAASLAVSN